MKALAKDSMRASANLLDEDRLGHNFEIFGFDFMIDNEFRPWLIEINTNPCLEINCPIMMDLIPSMIENAIKIAVDPIFQPPHEFHEKRPRFSSNAVEDNRFELLFDCTVEDEELRRVFEGEEIKLNFKELERDQD